MSTTPIAYRVQPGSFVMNGGTIRSIFQLAYPSDAGDPIGAPDWMLTERYDLEPSTASVEVVVLDHMERPQGL